MIDTNLKADFFFIGRQKEKELFRQTLKRLSTNPVTRDIKPMLNLWGVGGIGKTALIHTEFRNIINQAEFANHGWKYTYLDLSDSDNFSSLSDYLKVLGEILQSENIPLQMSEFIVTASSDIETATRLARHLIDTLKTNNYRLVLVLDNLDRLSNRSWLENLQLHLLPNLLNSGLVLLVTGSRNEAIITNLALRIKLQNHQLYALNKFDKDLIKQFANIINSAFPDAPLEDAIRLAETLLELSAGYPEVLNYLWQEPALSSSLVEGVKFLQEHKTALRIRLMNYVLDKYVQPKPLSDIVPAQFHQAFRDIAIFRRFDDSFLKEVVTHPVQPDHKGVFSDRTYSLLDFMRLIQEMKSTDLAVWKRKRVGYVLVEEGFRELLLAGLQAEDPIAYQQRHYNAVHLYARLTLSRNVEAETVAIYLIELIYHLAVLAELESGYTRQLQVLENYIIQDGYFSEVSLFSEPEKTSTAQKAVAKCFTDKVKNLLLATTPQASLTELATAINMDTTSLANYLDNAVENLFTQEKAELIIKGLKNLNKLDTIGEQALRACLEGVPLPFIELIHQTFNLNETQQLNIHLKSKLTNIDEKLFQWL